MKKSKRNRSAASDTDPDCVLLLYCSRRYRSYRNRCSKNINTGLDLPVVSALPTRLRTAIRASEDMSDTVYKLQKRVEQYSTEAQVYQEGSDRITS